MCAGRVHIKCQCMSVFVHMFVSAQAELVLGVDGGVVPRGWNGSGPHYAGCCPGGESKTVPSLQSLQSKGHCLCVCVGVSLCFQTSPVHHSPP